MLTAAQETSAASKDVQAWKAVIRRQQIPSASR